MEFLNYLSNRLETLTFGLCANLSHRTKHLLWIFSYIIQLSHHCGAICFNHLECYFTVFICYISVLINKLQINTIKCDKYLFLNQILNAEMDMDLYSLMMFHHFNFLIHVVENPEKRMCHRYHKNNM